MRVIMLLCLLPIFSVGYAQTAKVNALPEFVYIPPAPDKYVWEKVAQVKGRTLFYNSVACSDSVVYSFGGFDTKLAQREVNRLDGKQFIKDTLRYPGQGFISNVFFVKDSLMYAGGGHDSGKSRYAFSDFWQYNLHTHTWKRLHDLPFYYGRPPIVFTEDKRVIVLIARLQGQDFQEAVPLFYEYNSVADNWTIISKELPASDLLQSMEYKAAASSLYPIAFRVEDNIYVLFQGGCIFRAGCSNTFFRFSLHNHEWTRLPSFPGRLETYAFALSDDSYGYIGGGLASSMVNRKEVYRYDPEKEKWEQITSTPRGIRYGKGWRYKGESYLGFGINDKDNTIAVWKLKQRK